MTHYDQKFILMKNRDAPLIEVLKTPSAINIIKLSQSLDLK